MPGTQPKVRNELHFHWLHIIQASFPNRIEKETINQQINHSTLIFHEPINGG